MTRVASLAVLLGPLVALGGGCGGGAMAPPVAPLCPNDTPAACPETSPSFARDVTPILRERCGACHVEGGVESVRLFGTWAQAAPQSQSILSQIHTCRMPPATDPPLTAGERQIVLGWVVCGAPDN